MAKEQYKNLATPKGRSLKIKGRSFKKPEYLSDEDVEIYKSTNLIITRVKIEDSVKVIKKGNVDNKVLENQQKDIDGLELRIGNLESKFDNLKSNLDELTKGHNEQQSIVNKLELRLDELTKPKTKSNLVIKNK